MSIFSVAELKDVVREVRGQLRKLSITASNRKDRVFLGVDVGRYGYITKDNIRDMCLRQQLPADNDIIDAVGFTYMYLSYDGDNDGFSFDDDSDMVILTIMMMTVMVIMRILMIMMIIMIMMVVVMVVMMVAAELHDKNENKVFDKGFPEFETQIIG